METVLITGASSGIGLELARLFAADHANLVLVARRRERLEQIARKLRSDYAIQVHIIAQDLSLQAGRESVLRKLATDDITIDVLVNNAGFGAVGRFANLSKDRQMDMLQVNAVAVAELSRSLLPSMIERGNGAILNVASTAAFQPGPNMAVYFATKAFVLSLSEALAEEVRGTGVSVTCFCPGPTKTEFGKHSGVDRTLLFRLGTISAQAAARQGHRALRKHKVIHVTGIVSQLVTFMIRFVPRSLVRKTSAILVGKK